MDSISFNRDTYSADLHKHSKIMAFCGGALITSTATNFVVQLVFFNPTPIAVIALTIVSIAGIVLGRDFVVTAYNMRNEAKNPQANSKDTIYNAILKDTWIERPIINFILGRSFFA